MQLADAFPLFSDSVILRRDYHQMDLIGIGQKGEIKMGACTCRE